MITLNSRQETIANTVDAHFRENLDLFAEECSAEEFETYLQDYAGENYISESDWKKTTKEEYLKKVQENKKTVKPKAEKKFVKTEKQIGQVDKVFEKAKKYVNFESLANQYGLIMQDGSDGWKNCCCPFPTHDDSSPSFGINFKSQIFNCFGCHEKGDAIKFIALMEQIEPIEVARSLVAENETPQEKIDIHSLSPEDFLHRIDEVLTTPDGDMAMKKESCDHLAKELSRKVNLLLKNDPQNIIRQQKVLAEAGSILARYFAFAKTFEIGFGSKKELNGIHKMLFNINEKFNQVK